MGKITLSVNGEFANSLCDIALRCSSFHLHNLLAGTVRIVWMTDLALGVFEMANIDFIFSLLVRNETRLSLYFSFVSFAIRYSLSWPSKGAGPTMMGRTLSISFDRLCFSS